MPGDRRPPGRIFINYRRDDAAGVAGRMADTLNGYFGRGRVFRDVDGIDAGTNFEDVLRQTAGDADAMIVLIGPRWLDATDAAGNQRLHDPDDWVAREIAAALARGIPVYPVLVESAVMPRPSELPDALRPLSRLNAISVSDQRWRADVDRLAKIVAIDLPASATQVLLRQVQLLISVALVASVGGTAGWIARNAFLGLPPLSLAVSGVTFVVTCGAVVLLLLISRLVERDRRIYVHLAWIAGLAGTLGSFLWLGVLTVSNEHAPIAMFFGSTTTAITVLAIMGLSGFRAR